MKIRYLVIGALLLTASGWWLIQPAVVAKETTSVVLTAEQVINGNYYTIGNNVDIAGKVASDVFVMGNNVEITGEVGGDLFVLGDKVLVKGRVAGNIRALAGTVEIAGSVGKNVLVAAANLILWSDSQVGGHITAAAGSIKLSGKIEGSVLANTDSIVISGNIKGPVRLNLGKTGRLELTSAAVVENELVYQATRPAIVAAAAQLASGARQEQLSLSDKTSLLRSWWRWLVSLFGALVLAMVMVKLTPHLINEVSDNILAHPMVSLGWGLVWAIITPLVCLILFFSLIGIPLALIILAVYLVGFLVAQVFIAGAIVSYLRSQPHLRKMADWSPLFLISLGLILYYLLVSIPVLGWLILLLSILISWGGVIQFFKQRLTVG